MKRFGISNSIYLPFFLVFVSGAVAGAFGHRLYTMNTVRAEVRSSPEEYRKKYSEEMRTRLALSDQQVGQLNVILDETRGRYRELYKRSQPEMKAIQDEQVSRIRAILTDEQKAGYEKLREEREKRRQEHMKKSGGPDRGPGF